MPNPNSTKIHWKDPRIQMKRPQRIPNTGRGRAMSKIMMTGLTIRMNFKMRMAMKNLEMKITQKISSILAVLNINKNTMAATITITTRLKKWHIIHKVSNNTNTKITTIRKMHHHWLPFKQPQFLFTPTWTKLVTSTIITTTTLLCICTMPTAILWAASLTICHNLGSDLIKYPNDQQINYI